MGLIEKVIGISDKLSTTWTEVKNGKQKTENGKNEGKRSCELCEAITSFANGGEGGGGQSRDLRSKP